MNCDITSLKTKFDTWYDKEATKQREDNPTITDSKIREILMPHWNQAVQSKMSAPEVARMDKMKSYQAGGVNGIAIKFGGSNIAKSTILLGVENVPNGVTIATSNGTYTFRNGSTTSEKTEKGSSVEVGVATPSLKTAPVDRYNKPMLFNEPMTGTAIDEVFLDIENITESAKNTEASFIEQDKNNQKDGWDEEHSKNLTNTLDEVLRLRKYLRTLQIKTNAQEVTDVLEPYGQFDANAPETPISILSNRSGQYVRNRFAMSNQETLTHEMVHAALDWVFSTKSKLESAELKAQISDLYAKASDNLTWESLLNGEPSLYSEAEIAKAKELYGYIFEGKATKEAADVRLQEFMAYAMTNKNFQEALEKIPVVREDKDLSNQPFFTRIFNLFVQMVQDKVTKYRKSSDKNIKDEATKVIYDLIAAQDKYATKAANSQFKTTDEVMSDKLGKAIDAVDSKVKKPLDKVLQATLAVHKRDITRAEVEKMISDTVGTTTRDSNFLQKARTAFKLIKVARIAYTAGDEVGRPDIAILFDNVMSDLGLGEDTFMRSILKDFSAGRKTLVEITDLTMEFRSHIDRLREKGYEGTLADIRNMFKQTKIYSKENSRANESLGLVGLYTDLQSLDLPMGQLISLLSSPTKRTQAIQKIENKLSRIVGNGGELAVGTRFIADAKAMAQYMNTGVGLRSNAENVTRMFGTGYAIPYSKENFNAEYTKDVDKLASLYAMDGLSSDIIAEFITLANEDPKGVQGYLDYAKGLQASTKAEMLLGEPQEYTKGQVHDVTNREKDIVIAPMFERAKMERLGYTLEGSFKLSSLDKDSSRFGKFVNTSSIVNKRVDGAASFQRASVRGVLLSDKVRLANPSMSDRRVSKEIFKAKLSAASNYDGRDNTMHPVYDQDGYIKDFRYTFTRDDLVQHVELETRGTDLLGRSFGQIGTLPMTNKQNRKLVDLINKDKKGYKKGRINEDTTRHYLKVEPKELNLTEVQKQVAIESGNKALIDRGKYGAKTQGEEIWSLLPPDTREYIIEQNNKEDIANGKQPEDRRELYIRKDLLTQLFAYDEPSITDNKFLQKLDTATINSIKKGEGLWKDIVAIAKANVVVKLPATIIGNIVSNARFLFYSGIPVKVAIKQLINSYKSLRVWKADEKLLGTLERQKSGLDGDKLKVHNRKISQLKAKMDQNPLAPLMAAGLYQSVVEDVSLTQDNNKISKALTGTVGKVIKEDGIIDDVVQNVFLTRKSLLGKFLVDVTQESDFHFRAVEYFEGKSLSEVREDYINYSKVFNSKFIHLLDRLGPEAFAKYWFNIQRVILKRLRNNTSRVLIDKVGQETLGNFSPLASDIVDSNLFTSIMSRLSPIDRVSGLVGHASDIPLWSVLKGL